VEDDAALLDALLAERENMNSTIVTFTAIEGERV
jgi:hypothetical protein